jgi:UDP-GlcNAc:undecaprenyl-phosphate GlcNAc-1-phosphate transferase
MTQLMLVSAICAFALAAAIVPLVRLCFRQLGFVDKPDRERKLHTDAVSLGGGLAVFLSVGLAFGLVLSIDRYLGDSILGFLRSKWYTLFGAAGTLMLVGLIDDIYTLRGRQKLLFQLLIVVAVVGSGTLVQKIGFFGSEINLGNFAYPLTVLWLLAAINALNLIDGADGMASTAGAIISAGLAVLCILSASPLGAVVAAALAGALIGFLVYNRPPATIYLGDAGSMVVGLFIGVISIWSSVKGSTLLSVAPLVVLTVPLFDSLIAILRRVLTGRSIYATDRGHLHHRLLDRFSHATMLVVVAILCATTTFAAILSVYFGHQIIAFAGVAVVLGALVFTRSFGDAELRMLASRTSHIGESILARSRLCETASRERAVQLQGNRCWDAIWTSLVEFAGDRGLAQLKLDIGIAWMHEGYHGAWQRSRMPDKSDQATLKLPIYVEQRLVGRLEVICDAKSATLNDTLQLLLDRASELSEQIKRLIETNATSHSPSPQVINKTEDMRLVSDRQALPVNIVETVNLGTNEYAPAKDYRP